MKVSSRAVAREIKSGDSPDLYAGISPFEGLKAMLSTAANRQRTFGIMLIGVSLAQLHAKARSTTAWSVQVAISGLSILVTLHGPRGTAKGVVRLTSVSWRGGGGSFCADGP